MRRLVTKLALVVVLAGGFIGTVGCSEATTPEERQEQMERTQRIFDMVMQAQSAGQEWYSMAQQR